MIDSLSQAVKGEQLLDTQLHFTRESLVCYAGASGDFNPIHYRDDIAAEVGLPGVLAHGMLTMGAVVQPLLDLLGDPARLLDYQVRFTRPVVVDAVSGADVRVVATIGEPVDAEGVVRIDLAVTFEGRAVLGKAQLRVVAAV